MTSMPTPRDVHLVGSVPLASAEEVFRTTSSILGGRLKKFPDGETGHRKNWINFQYAVIARHPDFEFSGPPMDPEALANESDVSNYRFTPLRLRPGADASTLKFPALGYAQNALASWGLFSSLQSAGVIPAEARFQVSLPSPLAPVCMFVVPQNIFAVHPRYLEAMFREVDEIAAAIPHERLAIQWDVAIEIGLWEGVFPPPPGDFKSMLVQRLAELADRVPAEVQMGYHLCYGDRGHKHFIEPRDTTNLVDVANRLAARVKRPLNWLHVPVPRNRDDVAYFAPLAGLALPRETELFLGLVHHTDGVEGTRRRIAAAEQVVKQFGIGTECGLGRRDPKTIPELLRIHAGTT